MTTRNALAKRYAVCVFPSLYGAPWKTNYRWLANFYGRWRLFCSFIGYCVVGDRALREVRIIDYVTGEHRVW